MRNITFYLDFLSLDAYIAFVKLPQILQNASYSVTYRPVCRAWLKPLATAPIAATSAPLYLNECAAQDTLLSEARQADIEVAITPAELHAIAGISATPLLQIALAFAMSKPDSGTCNRYVCGQIFQHVWQSGANPLSEQNLAQLQKSLCSVSDSVAAISVEHNAALHFYTQHTINKERMRTDGIKAVPAFVEPAQSVIYDVDDLRMV